MISTLLEELDLVGTRICKVEEHLDVIASNHPEVALLHTIPGIGPRTAEAIVAFTDRVDRFPDRKHFASYFGMTPREDSSGGVLRRGGISKRGPAWSAGFWWRQRIRGFGDARRCVYSSIVLCEVSRDVGSVPSSPQGVSC